MVGLLQKFVHMHILFVCCSKQQVYSKEQFFEIWQAFEFIILTELVVRYNVSETDDSLLSTLLIDSSVTRIIRTFSKSYIPAIH